MENERQQFSRPDAEGQRQQEYYGWQYEPDEQAGNQYPAVPDMGSSLGYGQGMEYQYFDAPQPSQPIAQLRQDRLQQLRQRRTGLQHAHRPPIYPGQRQETLLLGEKLKQLLTKLSASLIQFQKALRSPAYPSDDVHPTSPAARQLLSHNAESTLPQSLGQRTAFPRSTEQPFHTTSPSMSSIPVSPRLGLPAKPAGGTTLSRVPTPPNSYSQEKDAASALPEADATDRPVGALPAHLFQAAPLESEIPLTPPAQPPMDDTGTMQRVRITRAAIVLTSAFVASRVLGLLRTSMFAFVFGTSSTSDAYLQAFLIPDFIYNIVAGGALSSAFIPVFAKYMTSERDEKTAWHVTSSALNLAIIVMSALALFAIIFARVLVPLYNPGITDPQQLDLIAALTRIMLLQSLVLGAGVIVTSVLNALQHFRLPAIGTVLYNVGLIMGLLPGALLALIGQHNDQIAVYAATWGVVLGAVFQVGVQVPGLLKVGMRYTPSFDWRHPGVGQIARQMVPRVINAAMLYVSIFVDRGLILLMVVVLGLVGVNGLITEYYQALQLVLLPLGIFGMSVSTAAFPTLAENVARQRYDRVRVTILTTLRSILFLSIPSSIGLIVLNFPIVQVLLQHGQYTLQDAQSTAVPLAFFAVGLTGLSAVEILTRSFYAMRDSVTPVIVSVAQFVVKITLSLVLINVSVWWGPQWGLGALALCTSIAGLLEAGVMFWLLHLRIGGLQWRVMGLFVIRIAIAALAMGVVLLIVRGLLDMIFVTTLQQKLSFGGTLLAILKLVVELFVGMFIYVRAARYLNIEELGPVKRVLDRLKLSWI